MKSIFATLLAFLSLCALTACNDSKFEGRTAQEWAAEAKKQAAARAAPPAASAVVKVDDGAEQAKRKQQQDAADDSYLSVVDQQVAIIDNQKDGGALVLKAAIEAVTGDRYVRSDDDLVVFGHFSWTAVMTANEVIAPARPVSGDFSQNPGSDAVEDGNAKIRRSVIAWAVKNPTAVSSFWTAFRPALRQQYGLLKTVRGHAQLYSTPYTRAAFEPLAECLRWYQDVASTREGKETQISEVDQTRCAGIFKKFGVKADFAKVVQDNLSTRNSLWLVQFFARRDADGGEGFVRKIQGMMADYAK